MPSPACSRLTSSLQKLFHKCGSEIPAAYRYLIPVKALENKNGKKSSRSFGARVFDVSKGRVLFVPVPLSETSSTLSKFWLAKAGILPKIGKTTGENERDIRVHARSKHQAANQLILCHHTPAR
jgi:hypothetical protein